MYGVRAVRAKPLGIPKSFIYFVVRFTEIMAGLAAANDVPPHDYPAATFMRGVSC